MAGSSYAQQTSGNSQGVVAKSEVVKLDRTNARAAESIRSREFPVAQKLLQSAVTEAKKAGYRKGEGNLQMNIEV